MATVVIVDSQAVVLVDSLNKYMRRRMDNSKPKENGFSVCAMFKTFAARSERVPIRGGICRLAHLNCTDTKFDIVCHYYGHVFMP